MDRRALILSYHFYPDPAVGARRISELALAMRDEGWELDVVAASPPRGAPPDPGLADRVRGLKVRRVPVPPKVSPPMLRALRGLGLSWGGNAAAADQAPPGTPGSGAARPRPLRKAKHLYHSLEALFDARKLWTMLAGLRVATLRPGGRVDLVISCGPPMCVHLPAALARRRFGARWVIDLRDPWMGNTSSRPELMTGPRVALEGMAERFCMGRVDRVVCASPGTRRDVLDRYPALADRTEVILNGFDGEARPGPERPRGRLTLLFAGMIYFNRNPFPLLEALRALLSEPDVERDKVTFDLVGGVAAWRGRSVAAWAQENGLADRVRIRPAVASGEVRDLMEEADVLVNFAQGQPRQIPAKTFEYLAAGREMLLISEPDSDSSALLREVGAGRVVPPDDPRAMRDTLRALYDAYVVRREPYVPPAERIERHSRRAQNRRYLDLIRTL